ncbi:MAG: hypothetical protein QOD99_1589 [Chthoniobacter sp.]|nr:hypothetical protein [Chthoniobacter sp.]
MHLACALVFGIDERTLLVCPLKNGALQIPHIREPRYLQLSRERRRAITDGAIRHDRRVFRRGKICQSWFRFRCNVLRAGQMADGKLGSSADIEQHGVGAVRIGEPARKLVRADPINFWKLPTDFLLDENPLPSGQQGLAFDRAREQTERNENQCEFKRPPARESPPLRARDPLFPRSQASRFCAR